MLTPETYATERAICDKAAAYWKANATYSRGGWSNMSAALAAHPDYAACDNAMRGRVEQFELARDRPDRFTAYIQEDNALAFITTWTGDKLGDVTYSGPRHRNNFGARWQQLTVRTIWGDWYSGRWYFDAQQCINLRRVKAPR